MKHVALVCLLILLGCCNAKSVVPESVFIFSEVQAHNLIKTVCYRPPDGITGYWTPQKADLAGVEDHLTDYLKIQDGIYVKEIQEPYANAYLKHPINRDWNIIICQAAGFKRGTRKFLFLNYVSNHFGRDLTTYVSTPAVVNDGGPYHFRVVYDLKARKFVWCEYNGF